MTNEDITPEGSVVPVYLDPTPKEPAEIIELPDTGALRRSGIDKLMALGLTEAEAKAIAGI